MQTTRRYMGGTTPVRALGLVGIVAVTVSATGVLAPLPAPDLRGTITATIDDQDQTWYPAEGTSATDRPYASSAWIDVADGRVTVSLGGFDTEDPPIGTFEYDPETFAQSYGTYTGSVIAVMVSLDRDATSLDADLSDPSAGHSVVFMRTASVDVSGAYIASGGRIEVTDVRWHGDLVDLRGRFRATVTKLDQSDALDIVSGTFDVSDVPSQAVLSGGT